VAGGANHREGRTGAVLDVLNDLADDEPGG